MRVRARTQIHMYTGVHPEVDVHCGLFMHDFGYFERLYREHDDDPDVIKIIINSVGGIEFQNQILSKTHIMHTHTHTIACSPVS